MQQRMLPHYLQRTVVVQQSRPLSQQSQNMISSQRPHINPNGFLRGTPNLYHQSLLNRSNDAQMTDTQIQYIKQQEALQHHLQTSMNYPVKVNIMAPANTNSVSSFQNAGQTQSSVKSVLDRDVENIANLLKSDKSKTLTPHQTRGRKRESRAAIKNRETTTGKTNKIVYLSKRQTTNQINKLPNVVHNKAQPQMSASINNAAYRNIQNLSNPSGIFPLPVKLSQSLPAVGKDVQPSNSHQLANSNSSSNVPFQNMKNLPHSKPEQTLKAVLVMNSVQVTDLQPSVSVINKDCVSNTSKDSAQCEVSTGQNISPGEWIDDIDVAVKVYMAYKLIEPFNDFNKKFIQALKNRSNNIRQIRSDKIVRTTNAKPDCASFIDLTHEPDIPIIKPKPLSEILAHSLVSPCVVELNNKSSESETSDPLPSSTVVVELPVNETPDDSLTLYSDKGICNVKAGSVTTKQIFHSENEKVPESPRIVESNKESLEKKTDDPRRVFCVTVEIPTNEATSTLYSGKGVHDVNDGAKASKDILHIQNDTSITNNKLLENNHSEVSEEIIEKNTSCPENKKRKLELETMPEVKIIKKKKKFDENKHGHLFDHNLHNKKLAKEISSKNQRNQIKKNDKKNKKRHHTPSKQTQSTPSKKTKIKNNHKELVPPLKIVRKGSVSGVNRLLTSGPPEQGKSKNLLKTNSDNNTNQLTYVVIHPASLSALKKSSGQDQQLEMVQKPTHRNINEASKASCSQKTTKTLFEIDMFKEKLTQSISDNKIRDRFKIKTCQVVLTRLTLKTLRKHNVSRENILQVYGDPTKEGLFTNRPHKNKHISSPYLDMNRLTQPHTSLPDIAKDPKSSNIGNDHETGKITTSCKETNALIDNTSVSNSGEEFKKVKSGTKISLNKVDVSNNNIGSESKLPVRSYPSVLSAKAFQNKVQCESLKSSSINSKKLGHSGGNLSSSFSKKDKRDIVDERKISALNGPPIVCNNNNTISLKNESNISVNSSLALVSQNLVIEKEETTSNSDVKNIDGTEIEKTLLSPCSLVSNTEKLDCLSTSSGAVCLDDRLTDLTKQIASTASLNVSLQPSTPYIGRIVSVISLSSPCKINYTENQKENEPSLDEIHSRTPNVKLTEKEIESKSQASAYTPQKCFENEEQKPLSLLKEENSLCIANSSCEKDSHFFYSQKITHSSTERPLDSLLDCDNKNAFSVYEKHKQPNVLNDAQNISSFSKELKHVKKDCNSLASLERDLTTPLDNTLDRLKLPRDEKVFPSSENLLSGDKLLPFNFVDKARTNSKSDLNSLTLNIDIKKRRFSRDNPISSPSSNEEFKQPGLTKEKMFSPSKEIETRIFKCYVDDGLVSSPNDESMDPRMSSLTYCGLDVRLFKFSPSRASPEKSADSISNRRSSTENLLAIQRYLRDATYLKIPSLTKYNCYDVCGRIFNTREEWGSHCCMSMKI